MTTTIAAASGQFSTRPVRNALIPPEGPQAMQVLIPFSSVADDQFVIDLTTLMQSGKFTTVQSIFVTNPITNATIDIAVEGFGTLVSVPAGVSGYFPIISPTVPKFLVTSTSTNDVTITFLNVPVPASVWSIAGAGGFPSPVTVAFANDTSILGRVGGLTGVVNVASLPVVTASSAYAAGDLVGGKLQFTGITRPAAAGRKVTLQSLTILFNTTQTAQFDLVVFHSDPAATTFTDKTTFSVNSADLSKTVAAIPLTFITQISVPSLYQNMNIGIPVEAIGSNNLFAAIVTRGTPTFTATSDILSVTLRVYQD